MKSAQRRPAAQANIPKKQHYVPRMLMRPFEIAGRGKHGQVKIFDKHTGREFATSIENVLAGRYFNTMWFEEGVADLEGQLGKLEDMAAPVVRQIVEERSLANLTSETMQVLALFLAVQFVRGPDTRARLDQFFDEIGERFKALGAEGQIPTGDDRKAFALQLMGDAEDLAKLVLKKEWLLFEPEDGEFFLGDTPLALHNDRTFGPYGNIGLAVPGIQIFVPLAPDLTLALWCPSLVREIVEGLVEHRRIVGTAKAERLLGTSAVAIAAGHVLPRLEASFEFAQRVVAAFEAGTPAPCPADSLRFMNHLQVRSAERYILARCQPFDLVREMLAHKDEYRRGLRLTF